jgi:hypothetical protein
MQMASDVSGARAAIGVVFLVALAVVGILLTQATIADLPAPHRSSAWWWFGLGWAVTAVGTAIPYVLRWARGTMLPNREQQARNVQTVRSSSQYFGLAVVLANAASFIVGPGVEITLAAVGVGLATALAVLGSLLFFTPRGRAMRARLRQ